MTSLCSFTIHPFATLLLGLYFLVTRVCSSSCIDHFNISSSFLAHGWIEIPINNIRFLLLMLLFFFLVQFLNLSHFTSLCCIRLICNNVSLSFNFRHCFNKSHLLTVLGFCHLFRWSGVPFFKLLFFDVNFFLG